MATKTIYLSGKIAWANHLFSPDEYKGTSKYKVDFYPDEKAKSILKDAGVRLQYKAGEYGMYVRPNRPTQKIFKTGVVDFGPPDITDSEGTKWDKGVIGNGSEATIKLSVFDTANGPGHRLEAVRIDVHVPYESEIDEEDRASGAAPVEGLPF